MLAATGCGVDLLLILAAGALVLTGLLMALAFRLERRSGEST
ncbi:MAG: hypothetical protein ACXWUI_15395 [Burkholderiales bacterium]